MLFRCYAIISRMINNRKAPKFLTFEDRKEIERLLEEKASTRDIATALGREHTGLLREIRRGGGLKDYCSTRAQQTYDSSKRRQGIKRVFTPEEELIIKTMIEANCSKRSIRERLKTCHTALHKYLEVKFPSYSGGQYNELKEKVEALEEQIKIIFEILKENRNDSQNK